MKKFLSLALAAIMCMSLLAGCGDSAAEDDGAADEGGEATTIQVAAVSTAFTDAYPQMWSEIAAAFEEATGIKVDLIEEKNLEDVIGPAMQSGSFPDVVYLPLGRPAALTEQFVKDKNITEITDVLDMTVPGEDAKVSDKLVGGYVRDGSQTNPYNDGKTYLAPMFYDPVGLFYNAGLFAEKGWEVPTTWDEMWELGDKAAAEGIYLFTYPTTGYFDCFIPQLLSVVGGPEFFEKVTHYEEGIWETPEADQYFALLAKLATYTHPITPAQANDQDFSQNQQLILDNKALFIPNGTWLPGEMADAPRADGFEWGMCATPALTEGGDSYAYSWFQQVWIPAGAENVDSAKQFVAFLYSDAACEIFLKGGAVQPVVGVADTLEGEKKAFFSIFDNGAKTAMGGFATTESVAGLGTEREIYRDPMNGLVSGQITIDDWKSDIIEANDILREHMM